VIATYPIDGAVCDGVASAEYDPFFADVAEAELEADALAMCLICPAREACLAYAVETGQTFGIWGGKTQREIRYLIALAGEVGVRGRRSRLGHRNADKTHCAAGHPYDAVNTYYTASGERRCRTCRARIARARRRAHKTSGGER
jgi:WhiB family redox-sensing transcriptional regulator